MLAKLIEHIFRRHADAGEYRRITQRVNTDLRFSQLLHEIKEVFREVGLESHHEFLVVDAERISRIELDSGEQMADTDVLTHQSLALFKRQQVPRARFPEGVNEDVFLSAGA